jgi:hypothetical protein
MYMYYTLHVQYTETLIWGHVKGERRGELKKYTQKDIGSHPY